MAKWKLKASKEDVEAAQEQAEFEHAPPGYYVCTIDEMSHGPGKEGKDSRAEVILKPVASFKDGTRTKLTENYSRIWDYISDGESSGWKRAQFGAALGIKTKRGQFQEDIEMEKGKPGSVIGREVLVRLKKDSDQEGNYRAKAGNYLPKDALDGAEEGSAELDEVDPDEDDPTEDGEEGYDFEALGEAADEDDEEAQETLTSLAAEQELDPDDYETWAELAVTLAEQIEAGEPDAEPEGEDGEDGEDGDAEGEDDLYTEEQLMEMDRDALEEAGNYFDLKIADYAKLGKGKAKPAFVAAILEAQNGSGEEDPF
jgi:hypothetical protein